jgi:hypothetical protein
MDEEIPAPAIKERHENSATIWDFPPRLLSHVSRDLTTGSLVVCEPPGLAAHPMGGRAATIRPSLRNLRWAFRSGSYMCAPERNGQPGHFIDGWNRCEVDGGQRFGRRHELRILLRTCRPCGRPHELDASARRRPAARALERHTQKFYVRSRFRLNRSEITSRSASWN